MAKQSTKDVQEQLVHLGEELKFHSLKEYTFKSITNAYAPRYDMVWMLDVETLNLSSVNHLQLVDKKYRLFVAFEVGGLMRFREQYFKPFASA